MSADQPSASRKRRSRDWDSLPTPQSSFSAGKRQKYTGSVKSKSSTVYWDNLSKRHLTAGALAELERRNEYSKYLTSSVPHTGPLSPASCYIRNCTPETLNDIQRSSRQGGPDMSEAQGFPAPKSSLRQASSSRQPTTRSSRQAPTPDTSEQASAKTSSTRNSGPYDKNFRQHLIDHNVYPPGYRFPDGETPALPSNWIDIQRRLTLPRRSLSPSKFTDEDFAKFQAADDDATKEKEVTVSVVPAIEGSIVDGKCRSGGIPFRNLGPLTDGTIVPGNPDRYYGARPEQLDTRVREELDHLITPTSEDHLPTCPNFFLAAKGPNGTSAVAQLQLTYDGSLGARAIHSLQQYGQSQTPSRLTHKAGTITSSYHSGTLKMYTVSRAEPTEPHVRPKYYVHQLRSFAMTDTIDTFRQGATAYRNARDWTEEQRNEAIAHANAVLQAQHEEDEEVNHDLPTARQSIEDEMDHSQFVGESPSPESSHYTTPPTEQTLDTSIAPELPTTSHKAGKRHRGQLQSSSPMQPQQKRRNHADDQRQAALSESSTAPESMSTNISFQFTKHSLVQDEHKFGVGTATLSSDGRERDPVYDTVET